MVYWRQRHRINDLDQILEPIHRNANGLSRWDLPNNGLPWVRKDIVPYRSWRGSSQIVNALGKPVAKHGSRGRVQEADDL